MSVAVLRPGQQRAAAGAIAAGHADYPAFRHVFPDARCRARCSPVFFEAATSSSTASTSSSATTTYKPSRTSARRTQHGHLRRPDLRQRRPRRHYARQRGWGRRLDLRRGRRYRPRHPIRGRTGRCRPAYQPHHRPGPAVDDGVVGASRRRHAWVQWMDMRLHPDRPPHTFGWPVNAGCDLRDRAAPGQGTVRSWRGGTRSTDVRRCDG